MARLGSFSISSPHLGANAPQGRSPKAFIPVFWRQVRELCQRRREIPGIGLEVFDIGFLGEPYIPGTDILTNVTASDPILQMGHYFFWQGFRPIFDSVIGDTAIGIDHMGLRNRIGRAGF